MTSTDKNAGQCAAEPLDKLPLAGYYGGKPKRISIEYDDFSSNNIGNADGSVDLIVDKLKSLYATQPPMNWSREEMVEEVALAIWKYNGGIESVFIQVNKDGFSEGNIQKMRCIEQAQAAIAAMEKIMGVPSDRLDMVRPAPATTDPQDPSYWHRVYDGYKKYPQGRCVVGNFPEHHAGEFYDPEIEDMKTIEGLTDGTIKIMKIPDLMGDASTRKDEEVSSGNNTTSPTTERDECWAEFEKALLEIYPDTPFERINGLYKENCIEGAWRGWNLRATWKKGGGV